MEALTIGEEVMNSFWHFVVLAEFVFSLEVKTEESTLIPTQLASEASLPSHFNVPFIYIL